MIAPGPVRAGEKTRANWRTPSKTGSDNSFEQLICRYDSAVDARLWGYWQPQKDNGELKWLNDYIAAHPR